MKKNIEFYNNNCNNQGIKLYEENKSIDNLPASVSILSITKCPLSCESCKTVYSNNTTGIKILCKCNCHTLLKSNKKEV
jgi:hypothetical protein